MVNQAITHTDWGKRKKGNYSIGVTNFSKLDFTEADYSPSSQQQLAHCTERHYDTAQQEPQAKLATPEK